MSTEHVQPSAEVDNASRIINDFTINVATANGTGSQTSNLALLRAMFRMGITVSGKNLFPSNIQGLPTWYHLRVNDEGYIGYREQYEIVVLMNSVTAQQDLANVVSGGVVFYDEGLRVPLEREDVVYYPMPIKKLVKEIGAPPALRSYIANMVYVGFFQELLGIEREEIRKALDTHFAGKQKAVDLNMKMVDMAAEWARENTTKQDPYWVERREGRNEEMIIVEGNEAAALGSVYGGVSVVAWYPITPATSVVDGINKYLPKLRKEEDGKATYSVIQAEDELAAIGAIVGAGWAGARAMTSTAGPGISLMAEFAGLAYFAEIPAVIWNVQRMGPSTGLPTRTSQGDLHFTYYLGHGDTRHVILLPGDPAECFEDGYQAFDIAEQLQTPVFVLSDLDVGMNLWMSRKFEYPTQPLQRGKVIGKEQLDEWGTKWGRFVDFDEDGICYRTLPGTDHPLAAYFTRGTGHDEMAKYSERGDVWENNLDRLKRKFDTGRSIVPAPITYKRDNAKAAVLSYGTNHPAIVEALDQLESQGEAFDYMRLRALPTNDEVKAFIASYDQVYILENNYSGQLRQILLAEYPELAAHMVSVSRCTGMPLSAMWITEQLSQRTAAYQNNQN